MISGTELSQFPKIFLPTLTTKFSPENFISLLGYVQATSYGEFKDQRETV